MTTRSLTSLGASLLLLVLVAAAPAATRRVAVLGNEDIQRTGLLDVLLVRLGELKNIALVERTAIEAALAEQELATVFGDQAVSARLALGRILSADLLVLTRFEPGRSDKATLIIIDATTGARLARGQFEIGEAGVVPAADEISAFFAQTRDRYPDGVKSLVAIPPLISRSLMPDADTQGRALACLLGSVATTQPGVALLEIEEARAIREEIRLSGATLKQIPIPIVIEGEYRLEGTPQQKMRKCSITLQASDGDRTLGRVEKSFESVDELVAFLRESAWEQLVGQESSSTPVARDELAAQLTARGDYYYHYGENDLAIENWHAALLLSPYRAETIESLVDAYAEIIRPASLLYWNQQPREVVEDAWRRHPAMFVEGLEITEQAYLHGGLQPWQAYLAYHRLNLAMGDFHFKLPSNPPGSFQVDEPRLLKLLDEGVERCTSTAWHWSVHVLPRLLDSEPKTWPEHEDEHWMRSYRRNPTSRIIGQMMDPPVYTRHPYQVWARPRSPELLAHQLEILRSRRDEISWVATDTLSLLVDLISSQSPNSTITPADVDSFLRELEQMGGTLPPLYAEFGRILQDHYTPKLGTPVDVATTLGRLNGLQSRMRQVAVGRDGPFVRARRVLRAADAAKAIAEPGALTGGPVVGEHDQPKLFPLPSPPATPIVTLERIRFNVRLKDGRIVPFSCSGWTDQHGYTHDSGAPWQIMDVEHRFDVFWRDAYLLWHRTPGLLEEVAPDRQAKFESVKWDGSRVWVGTCNKGIWLFDADGHRLDIIDQEDGLPAADQGMTIQTIEPGRAIVVGSFGKPCRSWCAEIRLTEQAPQINVFAEAARVHDDPWGHAAEADAAFEVAGSHRYYDPLRGGRLHILVGRRAVSDVQSDRYFYPLVIDPENLTVEPFGYGSTRMNGPAADALADNEQRPIYLPDGSWLVADEYSIDHHVQRCMSDDHGRATFKIAERTVGEYPSVFMPYDHCAYLCGARWFRVDLDTLNVEDLGYPAGLWPHGSSRNNWERISRSALFGLLHWYSTSRVSKVHIDESQTSQAAQQPSVDRVRVVDAQTKTPIAGASVQQEYGYESTSNAVDAAGECAIVANQPTVAVKATAEGYASASAVIRRGGHRNAVDGVLTLELRPLITIGGRILDKDGQPRAGVRVILCERNGTDCDRFTWHAPVTDAEGRWQTSLFEDRIKWRDFACLLEPSSGKWLKAKRLTREGREALLAGTHEIRIGKARSSSHAEDLTVLDSNSRKSDRETLLALHVLNSEQQPIAGASAQPLQIEVEKRAAQVPADPAGYVTLPWLVPRYKYVLIKAPGYQSQVFELPITPEASDIIDVVLEPITPIHGYVRNEQGEPVSGARVLFRGPTDTKKELRSGSRSWLGGEAVTDESGAFTIGTPVGGQVDLIAIKHEFDHIRTESVPGSPDEFLIIVQQDTPLKISGKVMDASTGEAISEFKISWHPLPWRDDQMNTSQFNDGQYTLLIPKPGKNIHLRMHTKGYYQEETVIEVDGRREVTYDVALKQHNTLRGIVLTADGEPCPDAAIGATDCCESLSRGLPIDRHVGSGFVLARTDAAGKFEMTSLRNRYQVMALTHAGYATAIVEPGDTNVTLQIRPYCRVSGRWAFEAGEGQDSVLRLRAVRGRSDRPGTYSGGTTEVNPQTGEFRFDQVLPGSYSIYCDTEEARNVPHLRREYHFDLADSEQLELTIPPVGGTLIGRIVASDDVKLTDIRINLRPSEEIAQQRQKISKLQYEQRRDPEHELAMTPAGLHATLLPRTTCHPAEDGTFKIEHLPTGKLRVLIQNKAIENQTLEIEIPPYTGEPPWPPFDLGTIELQKAQVSSAYHPPPKIPSYRTLQIVAGLCIVSAGLLVWVRRRKALAQGKGRAS